MTGPSKSAPTKSVLRVDEYDGEKVFRLEGTEIRVNRIGAYDLLPTRKERLVVRIYRSDKYFAEGAIEERGTHGAAMYFTGFESAFHDQERFYTDAVASVLPAGWLQVGDEIRCNVSLKEVRENILANWLEQVLESPEYAEDLKKATELQGKLTTSTMLAARALKRRKGEGDNFTQGEQLRLYDKAYRRSHAAIDRRLDKEEVPAVIRFED